MSTKAKKKKKRESETNATVSSALRTGVVKADVKKDARLNCITHFLSMIPYKDLTPTPPQLPPRPTEGAYVRPPWEDQTFVPEVW